MKKTTLILVVACGFAAVLLWRAFGSEPVDSVASARAQTTGPLKATRPAKDATTVRTHVVASRPASVFRTLPTQAHVEEEAEAEQLIKLERAVATQYPSEIEVSFRRRMKLLRFFDRFVDEADLTDEEIAAVKVAVYDAQSGFGEISRRVYGGSIDNILKPKRPNWIEEASDDAERQRRELSHNIVAIVGKERARLLSGTFETGLEVVSHRLFLKPGQPAVDLALEKTYP